MANSEWLHSVIQTVRLLRPQEHHLTCFTAVSCMCLLQLLWCTTVSWCVAPWTKPLWAQAPRTTSSTSSFAALARSTLLMLSRALRRSVQHTFVSCVRVLLESDTVGCNAHCLETEFLLLQMCLFLSTNSIVIPVSKDGHGTCFPLRAKRFCLQDGRLMPSSRTHKKKKKRKKERKNTPSFSVMCLHLWHQGQLCNSAFGTEYDKSLEHDLKYFYF